MKPRKPRKAIGPGDACKEMQRTAELRRKQDEERNRHRSKLNDLALQRQKAALGNDPAVKAITLARIAQKEIDENRRHRAIMTTLTRRIHKKP